jgi:hypothetical protein
VVITEPCSLKEPGYRKYKDNALAAKRLMPAEGAFHTLLYLHPENRLGTADTRGCCSHISMIALPVRQDYCSSDKSEARKNINTYRLD